jgi:hypothetical protein
VVATAKVVDVLDRVEVVDVEVDDVVVRVEVVLVLMVDVVVLVLMVEVVAGGGVEETGSETGPPFNADRIAL